uniref:BabAB n=1 Tax=Helicobacter pylori TaxID=210 RepID=A0A0N9EJF6_HELPX|nr:BabAB [Helicobacter pylori]
MKKHILSLTLGSLLVSTLSAEDDGFYMMRAIKSVKPLKW